MSAMHWIGILLPLLGAAAAFLMLRRALPAGRGATAGLIAAILLGPDVLGRTAPDFFERSFTGGRIERQNLERTLRTHAAELLAAETAGVDPDAIDEILTRQDAEQTRNFNELRRAHQEVRTFRGRIIGALVFLLLLFSIRRHGPPDPRVRLAAANIGLFSAALPASIAAAVLTLTGQPLAMILACAAPLAAGGIPRNRLDRDIGDQAEESGFSLMADAGRIATLLSIPLAILAVRFAALDPLVLLWPLLGIPAGLLLPRTGGSAGIARAEPPWVVPALLASVIALTGSMIAPLLDAGIGTLIGLMLLTTDGRWLGAVLGAILPGGRRTLPSMRLAAGAMAAAPAQVSLTAMLFLSGVLQPAHAIGLLVGAVLAEITAPLRRRAAAHLAAAETEIDHLRDDERD